MKNFSKLFAGFLCILVLICCVLPAHAADDTEYTVAAKAAMLIDLDSGRVLLEQNADEQIYPASLTKIMTCLLALELGNPDDTITVSESALQGLDKDSSTAGLLAGEQLTLEELLYCAMVSSANEACNAIAEYLCGTVDAFVELMNERALELGCTGTHFANPHGLHDANHYTTARDLSLIVEAALQIGEFVTICTTTEHTVPATNLSGERELHTTNYLVSTHSTNRYYYSKARGIKTGFTTPAGRCLISMASSGELNLLSIVCGAGERVLDSGDLLMESFTETRALFEWGFSTFEYVTLVSPLQPLGKTAVSLSSTADSAVYTPAETLTALLPSDYDPEKLEQVITLDTPDGIEAPVSKNQRLGTVEVYYDGELLGSTELLAIADIPRSDLEHAASRASSFFHSSAWRLIQVLILILIAVLLLLLLIRARLRKAARKRRADARRREQMRNRMRGGDEN